MSAVGTIRFYRCKHCGNVVQLLCDAGVPVYCCGEAMQELVPGTVEASHEKHVPAVTHEDGGIRVEIGSVLHPMTEEHHISWICLETTQGALFHFLKIGEEPIACFPHTEEKAVAVYAYCNLHGLWKTGLHGAD